MAIRSSTAPRAGRFAAVGMALLVVIGGLSACETQPPPHGITMSTIKWDTTGHSPDRTLIADISTDNVDPSAVNGPHRVYITLPKDYFDPANADKHYPVLYLLHGGGGGKSSDWNRGGGIADILTADKDLIVVMPDGGKVGWYRNWVDQSMGAQNWEDFYVDQLVPWVDHTFSTIPDRHQRGIAGLSMGGYGAVHLAQARPDLFGYVASFSGALNLNEQFALGQGTRLVINQQEAANGYAINSAFGSTDADYAAASATHPDNVAKLVDTDVNLYTGAGINFLDAVEVTMQKSQRAMVNALDAAGIPHNSVDYGRPGGNTGCDGGHNFGCWNYALSLALPHMMEYFGPAQVD